MEVDVACSHFEHFLKANLFFFFFVWQIKDSTGADQISACYQLVPINLDFELKTFSQTTAVPFDYRLHLLFTFLYFRFTIPPRNPISISDIEALAYSVKTPHRKRSY